MKDILEALPPHLFALASEAERAADKETMEQKRREEFDAPDDCEVWLTFGTLRKIERVFATINCIRTCSPVPAEDGLREALEHIRDRVRGSNDTLKSDIDKIARAAIDSARDLR